jgi:hypothetical protein
MKYRQVETALVSLFEVDDTRLGAFKGRLRHLRNLAIPKVSKAGSGTHAEYSRLNAVEMAIALELQSLGKSPRQSAELAGSWSSEIVHKMAEISMPLYLVLLPEHMDLPIGETSEITLIAEGLKELLGFIEQVPSLSVINASHLLHRLDQHLKEQAAA